MQARKSLAQDRRYIVTQLLCISSIEWALHCDRVYTTRYMYRHTQRALPEIELGGAHTWSSMEVFSVSEQRSHSLLASWLVSVHGLLLAPGQGRLLSLCHPRDTRILFK